MNLIEKYVINQKICSYPEFPALEYYNNVLKTKIKDKTIEMHVQGGYVMNRTTKAIENLQYYENIVCCINVKPFKMSMFDLYDCSNVGYHHNQCDELTCTDSDNNTIIFDIPTGIDWGRVFNESY